jgi:hypothetical protein
MTDLDETITLTNPENFPDNDVFRQGIVEAADFYHLLMENMTGQERLDLAEPSSGPSRLRCLRQTALNPKFYTRFTS